MRFPYAVVLVLIFATAARADWQYTRWGMTEDEVKKASHGAANALSASDQTQIMRGTGSTAALAADHTAGAYRFRAIFYFDAAGKLALVSMNSGDLDPHGASYVIRNELRAKYGVPIREGREDAEWEDITTAIRYHDVNGKLPSIEYRARVTEMNKGL